MKFSKSVLAGIFIGVGGAVCSFCTDKHIGAFMFSVGLYLVCVTGSDLFTGKVGYLLDNPSPRYPSYLFFVWVGNFIGAMFFGLLMRFAKPECAGAAFNTVSLRLAQPFYTTAILSACCGMLVYCAVNIFKESGRLVGIFLCVPAFILCGFEHCVADMYLFAAAGMFTVEALGHIAVVSVGNAIGAIVTNHFAKKIS